MPPIVKVVIEFAPVLVTLPVRSPVTGPANAVAVTVPETCSFVAGVVVPIPILDVAPSTVRTVVVVPPSFTLIEMSVSCVAFVRLTPVASTVKSKSLSAPTVNPESLTTPSVPDVVSLAFDLR